MEGVPCTTGRHSPKAVEAVLAKMVLESAALAVKADFHGEVATVEEAAA
jgi:hypothetical protein